VDNLFHDQIATMADAAAGNSLLWGRDFYRDVAELR